MKITLLESADYVDCTNPGIFKDILNNTGDQLFDQKQWARLQKRPFTAAVGEALKTSRVTAASKTMKDAYPSSVKHRSLLTLQCSEQISLFTVMQTKSFTE